MPDKLNNRGITPPDGGWGWVIVGFGMFVPSLYAGAVRCFSIFYDPLMMEYDVNYSQVTWLNGLFQAGYGIGSLTVPMLYKHIDYRTGVMASGLASAFFVFLSSSVNSLMFVQLCCGFFPGLCTTAIKLGVYKTVNRYFKEKRNRAMQTLCCGFSIGGFVYCPLYQHLISTFGWKGALLIISGLYLNIIVVGALLRPIVLEDNPPTSHNKELDERDVYSGDDNDLSRSSCSAWWRMWDLEIFLNLRFHVFNLSWITFAAAFYSSLTFLVAYGREVMGLDGTSSSSLVSAVSFGELGSRIVFGIFFDRFSKSNRLKIVGVIYVFMSALIFAIPFLTSFIPVLVICALVGAGGGGMDAVYAVLIVDTFSLKEFDAVFAYSSVVCQIAGCGITVLLGFAIDISGKVSIVFYIGAVSLLLSTGFILLLNRINSKHTKTLKSQQHQPVGNHCDTSS